jgi:tetratricopeptide (TPR) repeat protein
MHPRRALPIVVSVALGSVGLAACGPARPVYSTVPTALTARVVVPEMPRNPADPLGQLVWVLNYDLREFDSTWAWLQALPPSPERSRAIAVAILMGTAELDRRELTSDLSAFDEAIAAFPGDARLPLWRAFVVFLDALWANDRPRVAEARAALRATSTSYQGFTLFGLTLTTAADPEATEAELREALDAYESIRRDFEELQFDTSAEGRERALRLGDWASAPFNMAGTNALTGDIAMRVGDYELARRYYYTATRVNVASRWAWRAEVERRLADVEGLHTRFDVRPAQDHMLGARYRGAIGTPEEVSDPYFGGRVGNGSCTLCHTALGAPDAGLPNAEVGWVRIRYARPEGTHTAQPVFFALPSDSDREAIPVGFSIGVVRNDVFGPYDPDAPFLDTWIQAPAGSWFIAGNIIRNEEATALAYTAKEFGMPRYIDVRVGEVADITDAIMQWGPPRD